MSHVNYFPLVWYFTTAKQLKKIERIQKKALRDDYISDYETFLANTEMTNMRFCHMQNLCTERSCEANTAGESSSFIFTVCIKSAPLYHFKLAYAVLHMAIKEFFETHF